MDKILVLLLDGFKVKNPKVWAMLALVLTTLQYVLNSGTDLSVFQLNGVGQES